jgi:hypothetical protein
MNISYGTTWRTYMQTGLLVLTVATDHGRVVVNCLQVYQILFFFYKLILFSAISRRGYWK